MQRMREQRQYEKLRERYECRNSNNESNNPRTLWPSPELIQTILIEETLPVCAFGQLLTKFPEKLVATQKLLFIRFITNFISVILLYLGSLANPRAQLILEVVEKDVSRFT